MTLAHNWPKTVMSSWHTKRLWSFLRFYQIETICQKIDINFAPTGQLWLLSFFLPSSRRETAYALLSKLAFQYKDTLRAKNTEASIPVKG